MSSTTHFDVQRDASQSPVAPLRTRSSREPRRPHKVRYTEAEWAAVEQYARTVGRAPARYVREASLGTAPKAARSRADDVTVRELGRAGTALAQLAAVANSSGALPQADALGAALAELLAVVRRIG